MQQLFEKRNAIWIQGMLVFEPPLYQKLKSLDSKWIQYLGIQYLYAYCAALLIFGSIVLLGCQ